MNLVIFLMLAVGFVSFAASMMAFVLTTGKRNPEDTPEADFGRKAFLLGLLMGAGAIGLFGILWWSTGTFQWWSTGNVPMF